MRRAGMPSIGVAAGLQPSTHRGRRYADFSSCRPHPELSAALYRAARRRFTAIRARLAVSAGHGSGAAVAVTIFQILPGALRWQQINAGCAAPLGTGRPSL